MQHEPWRAGFQGVEKWMICEDKNENENDIDTANRKVKWKCDIYKEPGPKCGPKSKSLHVSYDVQNHQGFHMPQL